VGRSRGGWRLVRVGPLVCAWSMVNVPAHT
jgi:hypothetical protein